MSLQGNSMKKYGEKFVMKYEIEKFPLTAEVELLNQALKSTKQFRYF